MYNKGCLQIKVFFYIFLKTSVQHSITTQEVGHIVFYKLQQNSKITENMKLNMICIKLHKKT